MQEGDQRWPEVEALLGEEVLVAGRVFGIGPAFEDLFVNEALEARREDVAGDAEALLDLSEAAVAVHHRAHDQQRPALADHLESLGDRVVDAGIVAPQHERDLCTLGCIKQLTSARLSSDQLLDATN